MGWGIEGRLFGGGGRCASRPSRSSRGPPRIVDFAIQQTKSVRAFAAAPVAARLRRRHRRGALARFLAHLRAALTLGDAPLAGGIGSRAFSPVQRRLAPSAARNAGSRREAAAP